MKRDELVPAVRQRLERYPAPFDHHYGVVPLPPPEDAVSLPRARSLLEGAYAALGRAEAWGKDAGDTWIYSRILARQDAVSSSAIEGTHSTLDALLAIEEAEESSAEATVQVRDYALTLEAFIPKARAAGRSLFTADLIAALHQGVMGSDRDYSDVPGQLRRDVVYIGPAGRGIAYSTYNPPPPGRVAACLDDCLGYMRAEGMSAMTHGLITRMGIAHAHFEAVHPFKDGNGRTGRLLLPLMMAADGHLPLYLSPYIEAHKDSYYAALKQAQQKLAWDDIVAFMASAVTDTVAEQAVTRAALQRLLAIWQGRRKFRRNSAALRSLERLMHYPVITINRLAALLNVSFPAAATAVVQLEEAGILVERTGFARHRIFMAPEALTVINRPFGAVPVLPGGEASA